ncbi:SAM-dependent methyltransferase [Rhizobium sp. Leaf371]|uniref:class I SAM-dependent methyltransferase n=1 Tax=Rhizobium sp. Leaf371 TaxID=1736355 RepID=UPI000716034A|nr:class I SAM-dependent methyltransferase [Rhizobium sp. Leaf371]KQS68094.1 SAM-dependent methyltransferase [Rhizobium sp. Leaf371]
MTDATDPTLSFYDREAEAYAEWSGRDRDGEALESFMGLLGKGARVLELGCGGGHDSRRLLDRGFDVLPTDGAPEMARQAERRLGRPVRVMRFLELDAVDAFDGVWACACLLHAPRADLAPILQRIHRALRPGGVLYASFKEGIAEGADSLGRHFNFPSIDWLRAAFEQVPWTRLDMDRRSSNGYDGVDVSLITVWAHK